jgi:hypothetical protein
MIALGSPAFFVPAARAGSHEWLEINGPFQFGESTRQGGEKLEPNRRSQACITYLLALPWIGVCTTPIGMRYFLVKRYS